MGLGHVCVGFVQPWRHAKRIPPSQPIYPCPHRRTTFAPTTSAGGRTNNPALAFVCGLTKFAAECAATTDSKDDVVRVTARHGNGDVRSMMWYNTDS